MVIALKSHTQSVRLNKLAEIILITLLGVLMYVSQVIMAALPNIELVSLLIILATRKFGPKAFLSVYVFVGCEIATYGLGLWNVNYLYVWSILCFTVLLIRRVDSAIVYTLISAMFGLLFGIFCSIPYFLMGGISMGVANIISGIGFDITHCIGNGILAFLLYGPLTTVMNKLIKP